LFEKTTWPCSHIFHSSCVKELQDCGGVQVCVCCRGSNPSCRDVQWLVDEAATLIIQADRAKRDGKDVKKVKAYATELLKEASLAEPREAGALLNLGTALEQMGAIDGALAIYRAAIESHPDDAKLHVSLGSILGEKNDITGAVEAYRRAVEINPSDARSHCSLGVMLNMSGKTRAAIAAFRAACLADPIDASCHNSLGEMLAGEDDFDGAAQAFMSATEADPSDAEMHVRLGDVRRMQEDFHGAISSFEAALAIDPAVHGQPKQQIQQLRQQQCNDASAAPASSMLSANGPTGETQLDRRAEIERRRYELENQRSDLDPPARASA